MFLVLVGSRSALHRRYYSIFYSENIPANLEYVTVEQMVIPFVSICHWLSAHSVQQRRVYACVRENASI